MKRLFITLAFVGMVILANAQAPTLEVSRGKGKALFNCCKGTRGKCAIFVAEDNGNNTYTIPTLTTVYYDADYQGPYLQGSYVDATGRRRIDNVHITFSPSDCIDPDTGAQMEDCNPNIDDDMFFNLAG